MASSVFLVALMAAALTLVVAPGQTIAVFGAVVAILGLAINVYRDLRDRGELGVEVTLKRDSRSMCVRVYNTGRRPIGVEEIGFATAKGAHVPAFDMWSKPTNSEPFLPRTLGESDSKRGWASWSAVAWSYRDQQPATWIYTKPNHGPLKWWPLTDDVRAALVEGWENARRIDAENARLRAEAQEREATSQAAQVEPSGSIQEAAAES